MIVFYDLKSNFILYNSLIGSGIVAQIRTMREMKPQDSITVLALQEELVLTPLQHC